jgi:hypothetical protein
MDRLLVVGAEGGGNLSPEAAGMPVVVGNGDRVQVRAEPLSQRATSRQGRRGEGRAVEGEQHVLGADLLRRASSNVVHSHSMVDWFDLHRRAAATVCLPVAAVYRMDLVVATSEKGSPWSIQTLSTERMTVTVRRPTRQRTTRRAMAASGRRLRRTTITEATTVTVMAIMPSTTPSCSGAASG